MSKSTVSNVLRGVSTVRPDLRAQVERAVAELGYTPSAVARSLVQRRTHLIGFAVPDVAKPFYADVLRAADARGRHDGYGLLIGSTELDRGTIAAMAERRVDGLIACMTAATDPDLRRFLDQQKPVVVIEPSRPVPPTATVSVDEALGVELAVRHLVELGHTRIAAVIETSDPAERSERIRGYREALAKAGLPIAKELQLRDRRPHGAREPLPRPAVVQALLRLRKPPSAIVAGDDLCAIGIVDALEARGVRVPEDMSVVGFDDIAFAAVGRIGLTTVRQPSDAIGELAAQLLIEHLEGRDPRPLESIHELLEPQLVIRRTTRTAA